MQVRRSFPALQPALSLLALLSVLPLALNGCGQHTATHAASAHSAMPLDTSLTVRQSLLYSEAQRDCQARRYTQAAALLARLGRSPGLTAEGTTFCRQQQAICLRDAGLSVPTTCQGSTIATTTPTSLLTPEQADCGPRALALACDKMGVTGTNLAAFRRAAGTTGKGTTLAGLAKAAQSVGLKAKGEQVDLPALKRLSGPAIAWVDGNHYLAVLSVDDDTVTVHDPNHTREEEIPTEALLARSGGVLLTLGK